MRRPENPVAIVTGASSGIGKAVARGLSAEGWCVTLAARRTPLLQEVAHEIKATGGQALVAPTDVRLRSNIDRMIDLTLERWGKVDVLFNNAGVSYDKPLAVMDPAQVAEEVQVNMLAVIECSQAGLKPMLKQRFGHIVNMASIAGLIGLPTSTVYCAVKSGLISFSESLDREVRRYGVRVSAFCPFFVDTGFSPRLATARGTQAGKRKIPGVLDAEYVAKRAAWLVVHPRRCYIIPPAFNLIVWAARTFPWGADWLLSRFV
jgi:3-oxoacyl-[acyl-carrier protein] reductase